MSGASLPSDFNFTPKVHEDHIRAYFDKLLRFSANAFVPTEKMKNPESGLTVNFPFFKKIGAAQKPAVDEATTVDKLQDDSFTATIFEVTKAVGMRKGAIRKSALSREKAFDEAESQIGRVHAELMEDEFISEINTSGNYVSGYVGADATDANRMTIKNILKAKVTAFGDRHEEAVAIYMHSQQYLDLMSDSTAGFLKMDANSPFYATPGYQGSMFGMALILTDLCPSISAISSKASYRAFICKANAYGYIPAEEMDLDLDYDSLNREWVLASDDWYAVKAFHAKAATDDLRIASMDTATQVAA